MLPIKVISALFGAETIRLCVRMETVVFAAMWTGLTALSANAPRRTRVFHLSALRVGLVPGTGLEPVHSCELRILSPLPKPFGYPGEKILEPRSNVQNVTADNGNRIQDCVQFVCAEMHWLFLWTGLAFADEVLE